MACGRFGACAAPRTRNRPTRSPSVAACVWLETWTPAVWRNASKPPAVPLTSLQRDVMKLLASRRAGGSFVGGGVPLNLEGPRRSRDIDIFHDSERDVAAAAESDAASIEAQGFSVAWERRLPGIFTAIVSRGAESMRLDWTHDSSLRFYPPQPHPELGFALHPADLATGKVLAAAGRREARDAVDLLTIDRAVMPLAAACWAAVAKDPGYGPESLIEAIRSNLRYQQEDFDALDLEGPVLAGEILKGVRAALDRAELFAAAMPSAAAGLLFLKDGMPVQPDPAHLDEFDHRAASPGGLVPVDPAVVSDLLWNR